MLDFSRNTPSPALLQAGFALAALVAGCGAPPDGVEQTGSDQSAVSCPTCGRVSEAEGTCTLIAGADPSGLAGQAALLTPGAAYGGSNPTVLQAQQQLKALGTGGYFSFRTVYASTPDSMTFSTWDAVDVTGDAASTVIPVVNEYAGTSPVLAGYFRCTYSFTPGVHPYVPTYVATYAWGLASGPVQPPKGCTSCVPPI